MLTATAVAMLTVASLTARPVAAQQPLAVVVSTGDAVAEGARRLADEIGRIPGLSVHFEERGKSATELHLALRRSGAMAAAIELAELARFGALFAVDSVPFLSRSIALARQQNAVLRAAVERRLTEDGLAILMLLPAGPPRVLTLPAPIAEPRTLRGLGFVAHTGALRRFAQISGAAIIGTAAADTGSALRVVPLTAGLEGRAMIEFVGVPRSVVLIQRAWLAGLNDEQRRRLSRVAREIEAQSWADAEREAGQTLAALGSGGRLWGDVNKVLRDEIASASARLAEEWAIAAGADGVALLSDLRNPDLAK